MKTIQIGNKEYILECNAYTMLAYKKIFGTGIIQDVNILNIITKKQVEILKEIMETSPDIEEKELINEIARRILYTDLGDNFVEVITRVAWILIYTHDNNIMPYEEWLKSIERIDLSDKWVAEVTELAVINFR